MAGYCPSGKIRHETRAKADDHLTSIRRAKASRSSCDLYVYPCPECDGWHVGHRIGSRRKKRRAKR